MTLQQDIQNLIQRMEDNLSTMKVNTSFNPKTGLIGLTNKILDIPQGLATNLSINVPLNLTYTDNFDLTGTLLDKNSNPVKNVTVKLVVGNTVVGTTTTGNDGGLSFTTSPVSAGIHTFKLVFDGNNDYLACESSSVTRDVSKETTVLNLQNSEIQNEGVQIVGTLKTNDNEAVSNKTLKVYRNNVLIGTVTTNNAGVFDTPFYFNITEYTYDNFTVVFEGDDNYTNSNQSKYYSIYPPIVEVYANIPNWDHAGYVEVYYGDTVTFTLTSQSINNYANIPLVVCITDGRFHVIDTYTVYTDSEGVAEYTYTAQGYGSIDIAIENYEVTGDYTIIDNLINTTALLSNGYYDSFPEDIYDYHIMIDPNTSKSNANLSIEISSSDYNIGLDWDEFRLNIEMDELYYDDSYWLPSVNIDVLQGDATIHCYSLNYETSIPSFGALSRIDIYNYSTTPYIDIYRIAQAVSDVDLETSSSSLGLNNNESATLTATVTDDRNNPISGKTVTFNIINNQTGNILDDNNGTFGFEVYDDDLGEYIYTTSYSTITNSNGVATVTYTPTEIGEVYFEASCNTMKSSTKKIEVYNFYDGVSTSNLSKYTTLSNMSIQLVYLENRYMVYNTQYGTDNDGKVYLTDLYIPKNFKIKVDIVLCSANGNCQFGVGVKNDFNTDMIIFRVYQNKHISLEVGDTEIINTSITTNPFKYTVELINENNSLTVNLLTTAGSTLYSNTVTIPAILDNTNNRFFIEPSLDNSSSWTAYNNIRINRL